MVTQHYSTHSWSRGSDLVFILVLHAEGAVTCCQALDVGEDVVFQPPESVSSEVGAHVFLRLYDGLHPFFNLFPLIFTAFCPW